jgi:hypothetical protein
MDGEMLQQHLNQTEEHIGRAVAITIVIAVGAMFVLDREFQYRSDESFTSPSVRLPSHGNTHNLVGKDWYSAKEHGWKAESFPTSNSPTALAH